MGKRSGVTKSGRIMNPADRERKQMRLKELKRNKKERVKIRQTIVKSRDPRELIDHMERLDDQEFDLQNELALNVINDKRGKYRGAFIQMIALYRQEKDDKQVKELEAMLQDYEMRRFKKEQHYKAQLFSKSADPDEIPLPTGMMAPNAALTPFAPPPTAPQFHPIMKAGILKKTTVPTMAKRHRYPPGPPCGLPPKFYDEDDYESGSYTKKRVSSTGSRSRRVQFVERDEEDDEDYGPVEIPESMQKNEPPVYDSAPPPQSQPTYGRNISALIPPSMAPLPPRMPSGYSALPRAPPLAGFPSSRLPPVTASYSGGNDQQQRARDERFNDPNFSAVISAAPQVKKSSVEPAPSTAPVISAAPQMRNLKKETTRFVPTALRVNRPAPLPQQSVRKAGGVANNSFQPNRFLASATSSSSVAGQNARSTDEACDEFLREIQGLL